MTSARECDDLHSFMPVENPVQNPSVKPGLKLKPKTRCKTMCISTPQMGIVLAAQRIDLCCAPREVF